MYLKSVFNLFKRNRKLIFGLSLITLSVFGHAVVLSPGDAVFVAPSIKGDNYINVFNESGIFKKTDDGFVVTVPMKNKDGVVENQEFGYSKQDDIRTITIPGKGDLMVIKDENGDYNFELTPEQINSANNITCKVNLSGVGHCTISPFVKMVGSKLLTADKLVVGYKEGENLKVIGGTATNLKLTDKDSSTGFNKSEIDAGDTTGEVAFSKQGETKKSNSDLSLSNFFNNIATPQSDILNSPDEAKNADYYQISLETSKMVETVTNPNDRSQSATRFAIKDDQGISSTITMMNGEQSNLNIAVATKGGAYYNPKPFSENTMVFDTNAPVKLNYNIDGSSEGARSSLSLIIPEKDLNGNTSELLIVDTTEKGKTDTIKVTGGLGVNFSHATIIDKESGKNKIDPNSPIAFEVVSNGKIERNRVEDGKTTDLEVVGLKAQGTIDKGNINGSAVAESAGKTINSNGVLKKEIKVSDGIQYVVTEDDDVKKQSALAGKAYYNNGKMKGNFNDGVFIDITDYKNSKTAEQMNGKAIKRKAYASGQSGSIEDRDNVITINDGFVAQEVKFFDGSSQLSYLGQSGVLKNKDYNVKLDDSFYVQTNLDKNKDVVSTRVQASSVRGKSNESGDTFSILNTDNYVEKIGTTDSGKDILSISHTSDGIKYEKSDGDQVANLKKLQVGVVEADTVKYGTIALDEASGEQGLLADGSFSENLKITNINAAFYIDESDPNNLYRNGIVDLGKVQASSADYSMEVVAKDSSGNDSKFTIVYLEDGPNKNYKVFAEDGQLIHIKGQGQGKELPNTVFQSLEYFEGDTFKRAIGTQMSGSLITITPEDNKLQTFNFARVEGIQSINKDFTQLNISNGSISEFDYKKNRSGNASFNSAEYLESITSDGTFKSASIKNGNLKYKDSKGDANLILEQASGSEFIGEDGSIIRNVNLNSSSITSSRIDDKSEVKNLALDTSQVDSVKFGTVTMDEVTHEKGLLADGSFSDKIKITDLSAAFYIDDSDPNNKFKNGLLDMGELNVVGADYSVNVMAEGEKFSIYYLEDGPNKTYKVFSEDGSLIHIKGQKYDEGLLPEILFKELTYFESDTFKQLVGLEISGELDSEDSGSTKHQDFSIARVDGFETWDKAFKQYMLTDGIVNQSHAGKEGSLKFEKIQFTEQNNIDFKEIYGEVTNAVVDYKEIKTDGSGTKLEASLSIGQAIGRQITSANGDKITMLKIKNLDFIAVDFEELKKVSGSVGDISLYEDKNIQSIDIKDLRDLSYEDLKSGATANASADRILRVVEKNDKGEEISSYLLINEAQLNYADKEKGLNADIKIGVLELMQDKLNKQNIFFKADIKGKLTLNKSFGAEANVEFVGTNMIPGTEKYESVDGTRTKNEVFINTFGDNGKIEKFNISVGPSFKKDLFSIKAEGGKDGAKSLNVSIEQDKKEGTYNLVANLEGGEKFQIKALGATWDGVEIDQLITPKGQNLTNHIGIWGEIISTQKVNDYLALSPGGAISISSGTLGGYGVELIYVDEDNLSFKEDPNFFSGADQAKSFGLGIQKTNDAGDKSTFGAGLTGDSEFDIRTRKGKFSLFGVNQGSHARLPATANLYWKKNYADGDGAYVSVFYDTASAAVDTDILKKDAEFYKNQRGAGGAGLSLGLSKKLGEHTGFKIGAGVNQVEGKICAGYTSNSMEPIGDLVGGVYNVLHGRDFIKKKMVRHVPKRISSADKNKMERLKAEMDELEALYYGARAYDRVTRALKAAEDYLSGKIKYEGKDKERLKVSLKDLEHFARLEMDKGVVNKFDSIIGKIEEQKILKNPNLSEEDKVRWTIVNLQVSMDRLATNYSHTGTTSIYMDFNKKYQRLIKLGGNTTHLRYRDN